MSEILEPFRVPIVLRRTTFAGRDAVLAGIEADCAEAIREAARLRQRTHLHQVKDLHAKPYAKPLVDFVTREFEEIYAALGYDAEAARPFVTAMWGNAAAEGMGIHVHNHPNSFFSGVWYPHGCLGAGISFKNPIPASHVIAPSVRGFGPYNSPIWSYEFEEECFLYFPAWLEHWTAPNRDPGRLRYSVAFNFHLRGTVKREGGMSTLVL